MVQAASGSQRTPVGVATPNGDLIGPGVLLKDGQSSLSVLDVAPVKPAWAAKCRPVATDGLVISDGLPTGSTVYVHYVLARLWASSSFVNIDAGLFNAPTA